MVFPERREGEREVGGEGRREGGRGEREGGERGREGREGIKPQF